MLDFRGCSKGTVTKLSPDLSSKTCCQLHRGYILTMLFSCDGTYLASSGYDKHVYAARSNEVIFSVKFDSYCRVSINLAKYIILVF